MHLKPEHIRQAGFIAFCALAVVGASSVALAHERAAYDESSWFLDASAWDRLIGGLVLLTGMLYAIGLVRLRHTHLVSSWPPIAFGAGWLTLVIALLSPIDRWNALLFSVHMTQHELLMLVAAPLLVMSRAMVLMLWALPRRARRIVSDWLITSAVSRSWRALSGPFTVWLIHGLVLWAWHIPVLYEAALRSEAIHALQHASFFVTAALFWWALIYGRYGRMGYGLSVVYVFTTALHSGLLGALITFATHVWYPSYEESRALSGLTALEDQQIGGLVMWVPAGIVLMLVALALFSAWLGEVERRVRSAPAIRTTRG